MSAFARSGLVRIKVSFDLSIYADLFTTRCVLLLL